MANTQLFIRLLREAGSLWSRYKTLTVELVQIQTARTFLKSLQVLRMATVGIAALLVLAGMTVIGIGTFHVLIYMTAFDKVNAVVGLLIFDAATVAVLSWILFSQRMWMKFASLNEDFDAACQPSVKESFKE